MRSLAFIFTRSFILFIFFTIIAAADVRAQAYFDYDPQADLGVFRPSEGSWYSLSSETQTSTTVRWGLASDRMVPADYDGDGLTDFAVWRPESGVWYVLCSRDGRFETVRWGTRMSVGTGFVADETVAADYDGDGSADFAVWRPSDGIWYVLKSKDGYNPEYATYYRWGKSGDIPVPADYDGDRIADFAVFRPTENRWYVMQSATGKWKTSVLGQSGYDLLVPADYTGDEKTDFAIYRQGTWLIQDSATNEVYTFSYGLSTDYPVPADYNGDGMTDLGVFREGVWYIQEIVTGRTSVFQYGMAGDIPISFSGVKSSIVAMP